MSRCRNTGLIAALATASLALGFGALAVGQEPVAELTQRIEPEATYLNPLQINQWVGLSANKSITGKLVSLDEAGEVSPRSAVGVSLILKGKIVSRAVTGSDGMFQFKDISAGTYSFVAQKSRS